MLRERAGGVQWGCGGGARGGRGCNLGRRWTVAALLRLVERPRLRGEHDRPSAGQPALVLPLSAPSRLGRDGPGRRVAAPEAADEAPPLAPCRGRDPAARWDRRGRAPGAPRPG